MDKKKDKNQMCISSEFLWIFLVIIFILIIFGLYMFNIFPFNVSENSPVPTMDDNVSKNSPVPTMDNDDMYEGIEIGNGNNSFLGGVRIFKKK